MLVDLGLSENIKTWIHYYSATWQMIARRSLRVAQWDSFHLSLLLLRTMYGVLKSENRIARCWRSKYLRLVQGPSQNNRTIANSFPNHGYQGLRVTCLCTAAALPNLDFEHSPPFVIFQLPKAMKRKYNRSYLTIDCLINLKDTNCFSIPE